jgi:hypothetical protein
MVCGRESLIAQFGIFLRCGISPGMYWRDRSIITKSDNTLVDTDLAAYDQREQANIVCTQWVTALPALVVVLEYLFPRRGPVRAPGLFTH